FRDPERHCKKASVQNNCRKRARDLRMLFAEEALCAAEWWFEAPRMPARPGQSPTTPTAAIRPIEPCHRDVTRESEELEGGVAAYLTRGGGELAGTSARAQGPAGEDKEQGDVDRALSADGERRGSGVHPGGGSGARRVAEQWRRRAGAGGQGDRRRGKAR